ncbi:MAG: TRCF domain-containing protein, partial [Pirellulaceae bacterium]
MEAYLPSEYVPEIRHKIDLYRRLSRIDDVRKLEALRQEVEDRFGPLPPVVVRLLEIAELRIDATLWSVKSIGIEEQLLVFVYGDRRRIEQLARRHAGRLQ